MRNPGEVCRPQGAGELGRVGLSVGQRRRQERRARGGPATGEGLGQGTRGERTKNMLAMVVTPEVSQLETSALKFAMS